MIRDNFIKHKFYIITLFSIFIIIDTLVMYLLEGFVSNSMTTFRILFLMTLNIIPEKYYFKTYIKYMTIEDKIRRLFKKDNKDEQIKGE